MMPVTNRLLHVPLILGAPLLCAFAWCGCAGSLEDPEMFTAQGDAGVPVEEAAVEAAPAPACADVPTLFANTCGTAGCHDATTKAEALDLVSPGLASRLVRVPSVEGVGLLIDPTTPSKSVLYTKLLAAPPFGARMPTGGALDTSTTQCVLTWITSQSSSPVPSGTDAGAQQGADAGTLPDASAADTGTVAPFSTIRVAAGQTSAVNDSQGNTWGADTSYTGGTPAVESTMVSIANTDSPVLYNGQRYGNPSFSYAFTVPNGKYTVTLKFAELYVTASGQRLFDIAIDGTTVESAFDIYATAGAMNTAIDRSYPITVSSGQIKIDFNQGTIQFPKVDAIQIAQGSPDGGP
ncbi:MAG TPA: malectin [Polyangiaceae bacterium]